MNGQTAIVTGTSAGIGAEVARLLLKNGWTVMGLDKDSPGRGIHPSGPYYHFIADITDDDSVRRACAQIRQKRNEEAQAFAAPSHAILAAGGALHEEVCDEDPIDLDLDIFRRSVDVNLCGQYICIKHFVPLLLEKTEMPELEYAAIADRSITMVSSINSVGDFGYPAYASAKAGLAGLAKSLAVPLGRRGIRINVVAFGTVRTHFAEGLHASDSSHFSRLEKLAALERISTRAEAAQVLLSMTQLSSVTGTIITADCGQAVPGNHYYSLDRSDLHRPDMQTPATSTEPDTQGTLASTR